MKYIHIIPLVALSAMCLTSCYDQKMDWYDDPTHGEVTTAELPLALAEKISRYDVIKSYIPNAGFQMGIGMGVDLYMDDPAYREIVDANFNSATCGNAMKHQSVVNEKGIMDFTKIDDFFAVLPAGIDVYGHNLIWHSQQNATYLNSLIAPTRIGNLIGNGTFEEEETVWDTWGNGSAKRSEKGEGYNSDYCMVLTNNASGSEWDSQSGYVAPIENGKTYTFSARVKSSVPDGNLQLIVQNSSTYVQEGYKSTDVGTEWKEFTTSITVSKDVNRLVINFGKVAGTYYIDDIVFKEYAEAENLFTNSDFESASISPWSAWGNGTSALSEQGEGYQSDYALVLTNSASGSEWDAQCAHSVAMEVGKTYNFSGKVKSSVPDGYLQLIVQNSSNYAQEGYKGTSVGTEWQDFKTSITVTKEVDRLVINFGKVAGTYYLDDLSFTTEGGEDITIEKTDEEKTELIEGAMTDWIKGIVTHCKDRVTAWEVLNEPLRDNGTLRDGSLDSDTEDGSHFYWMKYLGKDYAVKAFQLARQYGNPGDKLFINEYGLESTSPTKLNALIDYVKYIESKGATVDGIGTQMHIYLDCDRSGIEKAFQTLAATGKLIKITELDVRFKATMENDSPISPTADEYAQQAELYQFVVDAYMKYIPAAQQWGITLWGLSDNAIEHEYWIPNDAPCVFDKDYKRKHAYKTFCDGLAGRDVSEDFTGELKY